MATFNYTGRRTIPGACIEIKVDGQAPRLRVFLTLTLPDDLDAAGCDVVMEAYLHTKAQRQVLGKAEAVVGRQVAADFTDFADAECVLFRIKVVDPASRRIRAVAERLSPAPRKKEPTPPRGTPPRRRHSALGVKMAEPGDGLGGRPWKVALSLLSKPTLLLSRDHFAGVSQANDPLFGALAKPAVVKEVLAYAFLANVAHFPDWSDDWRKLAVTVLGVGDDAPESEPEADDADALADYMERTGDWIDRVAAAFAARQGYDKVKLPFKKD